MSVVSEGRVVWRGRSGQAYDETAFRHFLARERLRSRAGGPVIVVLVELTSAVALDRAVVARLFSALSSSVRETDIVGWYRRDRVAGVVLTDTSAASVAAVCGVVAPRVAAVLERQLPATITHRVHLRVHSNRRPLASPSEAVALAVTEDQ